MRLRRRVRSDHLAPDQLVADVCPVVVGKDLTHGLPCLGAGSAMKRLLVTPRAKVIALGSTSEKGRGYPRPFPATPIPVGDQQSLAPMPPPPGPPAGIGVSFFGFAATIASVVTSRPATEEASCSAVRTTLAGSITPRPTRSPYSLAWASNPQLASLLSSSLPTTTAPSGPAFSATCRAGHWIAFRTISTPTRWSSLAGFKP